VQAIFASRTLLCGQLTQGLGVDGGLGAAVDGLVLPGVPEPLPFSEPEPFWGVVAGLCDGFVFAFESEFGLVSGASKPLLCSVRFSDCDCAKIKPTQARQMKIASDSTNLRFDILFGIFTLQPLLENLS
jgi:hypothetical protein